ncbi:hypothetical protein PR202_ga15068 [Eleusine coracana subsp. coracana]|uniref:Sodium/calcium exchanger membrane region domain-containing protein n=1 Tax=Eleusine coracana subsp. coracana TaxID=191504 RepID=A0AAV5CI25_ELECO|nr:hypothetical protein PR202_ga15068 [Eleusine coracana subsp. coracana]
MAFLHKLLKSRRSAVAGVASASFWALVLVFSVFLAARPRDPEVFDAVTATAMPSSQSQLGRDRCQDLQSLPDNGARCAYLRSQPPCAPEGYADYLRLFYCRFGRAPWLGGAALALWLLVLFYLLGDTASQYFCASLEGLSAALRLPPAVAGVTFLALGNGTPDVLSSVVAFASGAGGGAPDVGLSSALGGALFVSTVVTGVVALVAKSRDDAVVERRAFMRDVCFLLVALLYLLALLLAGSVTVWAAASFLSLYAAYVLVVWISHFCATAVPEPSDAKLASVADLTAPLLLADDAPPPIPVISGNKPAETRTIPRRVLDLFHAHAPYAVASAFLAPLLLAAMYSPSVLLAGALVGSLLAATSAIATDASAPPQTT